MGKASQLSQLKASLASSGLSRTSQPGGGANGKRSSADSHPAGGAKRKRGKDEEKALEKIRKAMNPFEERVMRVRRPPSPLSCAGPLTRQLTPNRSICSPRPAAQA
jgi:hypothetical protein